MTAVRPEREESPYDEYAYGETAAFEAAVERLADPLNDPLPGQEAPESEAPGWHSSGRGFEPSAGEPPSEPYSFEPSAGGRASARRQSGRHSSRQSEDAVSHGQDSGYGSRDLAAGRHAGRHAAPSPQQAPQGPQTPHRQPYTPPGDDETVALRTADTRRILEAEDDERRRPSEADGPSGTAAGALAPGGRAERRRAARQRGGRRRAGARHDGRGESRSTEASGGTDTDGGESAAVPLSRVAARRAARARKPAAGVIASQAIGEVFITIGVLMLLFVTYQLWWTNVRAHQQANGAAHHLQDDWAKGKGEPGVFAPGQGFAIMHIPKLDVVVPIAEGIDKQNVLDRGMVGHYGKDSINTPMPEANPGNFGVAGHRNTHGEPFRYINRLKPGDPIIVETQDTYYVYEMANILPQTSPDNTGVLSPVPPGSGFTEPGRYITLTTCTPEFTSKYRMIVWGKMVEERPRVEGKPEALVE